MPRTFRSTVNVWSMSREEVATLQRGQWVSAGTPDADRNNCGRFWGITKSGTLVVGWNGNARRFAKGPRDYQRTQYVYAISR
jgi:hypothetical protein